MTDTLEARQLRSLVSENGAVELSIETASIAEPQADEVVVKIEAAPVHPTDISMLFGVADLSSIRTEDGKTRVDTPERLLPVVKPRMGLSLVPGVESAGTVARAGSSAGAQALVGKTVAMMGEGMYSQYRLTKADDVLLMPEGVTAREAAFSHANPLTTLAMVETMHADGHKALVHTVGASALGQTLNRFCLKEGIGLVNIVRKPEQEKVLRDAGARYVVNSQSESFRKELTHAIAATGATCAFDAIGGGKMGNTVLSCMERALSRNADARYGSDTFKQLYVYGRLDLTPQQFTAAYGFAWGVSGWLTTHVFEKLGKTRVDELRQKVADEIKTTFATEYSNEVSLAEAITPEVIADYTRLATGKKYLINPWK